MDVRLWIGIALSAAVALCAALPATAGAATSAVPPGISGANQYTETLPGPGGNDRAGGGGSGQTPAEALGKHDAAKLEAMGAEGKAAAELAAETAPGEGGGQAGGAGHGGRAGVKTTGGQAGAGHGAGAGRGAAAAGDGSSGLDQVLGQVTGTGGSTSGGMGLLLPLLIAAALLAAAAFVLNGRRAPHPDD